MVLVVLAAHGTVSHQDGGLGGVQSQLSLKDVVKEVKKAVPVADDTSVDGVVELVVAAVCIRLNAYLL